MQVLYSNILPMALSENQESIIDKIRMCFAEADEVEIAVGYVSKASLDEIDRLVVEYDIKKITLIIGMYYIEGMPEGAYYTALNLNDKWQERNQGEIRMVVPFKYHGKVYVFYKQGIPLYAVTGSANLGVIKLEASNLRQYELCIVTSDNNECVLLSQHIKQINNNYVSCNIAEIDNISLIRSENTSLRGIELVKRVPLSDVEILNNEEGEFSFWLPLKVPAYSERHIDDHRHFTKSNINVCYAAPRSKKKSRDWFETQLTVSREITQKEGYPEKKKPFFIITDDGYRFKAHTTSDGNKQLSAVGDELIMGRWLKGRLIAAGLVSRVDNTQLDTNRDGMITKEMLQQYGCDALHMKKTGNKALDDDGLELDIWVLSFKPFE